MTNIREISVMWRQYFQNLLNCPPPTEDLDDNPQDPAEEEEVEPLNFEEIKNAIMRLKNNKAPGIDNLPSELWKYGGEALQSRLYNLIKMIWESEQQPVQWYSGVICPIHKKGSRKKCSNYRGIALLPTAYKILSYVLLSRLEPYSDKIIGDYQCGFRRNRSTVDQIFTLKQLMEKRWEYAQSIHSLFVDFAKAYDSIDRPTLYRILTRFKIPQKLVRMVEVATRESRMTVRVGASLTDEFDVVTGLRQGDALSPMLFNLALEHAIRKVNTLSGGVWLNGQHRVIGYADDLALLGERKQHVIDALNCLQQEASRIGLRVSHEKTEYLHMRRYKNVRRKREDLVVGNTRFKGVAKFRYLGCTVTDTNDREDEIEIRIQNTLRCSAALHPVLSSKLLSRRTKIRIYKTLVRPILLYGCEAWTLTQKEEAKLLVTERKVLRKILGPVRKEDGSWHVRKNKDVERLFGEPNILGEMKARRLGWLGHVVRMEQDRAVKRVYTGVPEGRRPVGRPKYRWCDAVEGDLRELQVSDWQGVAQRRDEWQSLLSEAKTHFGVIAPAQ